MKTVLMLTRKESSAFRAIAESVSSAARERGWAVHVATAADVRKGARLADSWRCDGCIVYAARPNGLFGDLGALRVATVCVSPTDPVPRFHSVVHDSFATGDLAARRLAELGLDAFAFAAEDEGVGWAARRLDGFRRGLKARGRGVDVFGGGNLRAWLRGLPKPCGLFAANDAMAERVISAAVADGIAIPGEVAVLGCDDDARICEHAEVTISSIRPDYRRCGELATESLAEAMERPGRPARRLSFEDEGVTKRASTRLLAVSSPEVVRALEFIRLEAFSGIATADVLAKMPGSRRSAETAFRAATGRSILEEIQAVRIAEAKRLATNPLVKLGSVASRVGYGSENFFARVFKRETGMTLREWRSKAIGNRLA